MLRDTQGVDLTRKSVMALRNEIRIAWEIQSSSERRTEAGLGALESVLQCNGVAVTAKMQHAIVRKVAT